MANTPKICDFKVRTTPRQTQNVLCLCLGKLLSFYGEESHFSGTFSRYNKTVNVLCFATVTRLTGSGRVGLCGLCAVPLPQVPVSWSCLSGGQRSRAQQTNSFKPRQWDL